MALGVGVKLLEVAFQVLLEVLVEVFTKEVGYEVYNSSMVSRELEW